MSQHRLPEIFVDADACPVKDEVMRVAERHGLVVHLVSNRWHRGPVHPRLRRVVVPATDGAADDWIAGHIADGDIAVTADIPLAARCLDRGAKALGPDGRSFTDAAIGNALATRALKQHLRETGAITGGPAAFARRDRSRFLSALENAVQAALRGR